MMCLGIMGLQTGCQQTFLSLGQAKVSVFLAMLRKLILLIPLILIIPRVTGLGMTGVFLAQPIADFIADRPCCKDKEYYPGTSQNSLNPLSIA